MSFTITGTGSALPPHVVTNDDIAAVLDTSDEWIHTRTGIRQRHVLQGDETVTGIALEAAQNALQDAGVTAEELDFILCATIGGDYITPSLGSVLQAEIGAECPAMDVNAACSGFMYALEVAAGMFARGSVKKMLVVAAEGLSRIVDWGDRATCVLFGDGAAAVVLEPGDDLLYLRLTSQGWAEPLHYPFPEGNCPGKTNVGHKFLVMNGQEVYKFAVNNVAANVEKALADTGISKDEIDHVVLHQANLRIIEAAQRRIGIPAERYTTNVGEVGNISAVSIPMLLDKCKREGRFAPGDMLLLGGFGGGLTTGTAIMKWGGK